MNRRDFFRRSALVAAGAVAADQLELLDRLGRVRTMFAGWSAPVDGGGGITVTNAQWDALLRETYVSEGLVSAINTVWPLRSPFGSRLTPLRQWSTEIAPHMTIDLVYP